MLCADRGHCVEVMQMLYMRVHCDYCGGTFEIYPKLREYDKARQCPHCDSRIDGTTWREKILPAFN